MGARYSRQAGYTVSKRRPQRLAIRTVSRKVRFGPTTAKYIGLGILGILALVMITKASNNATEAYTQNQIRTETSKVNAEVDNYRLEARREQAIENIQQTSLKDKLQPAGQVDFVEKGDVAGASTSNQ